MAVKESLKKQLGFTVYVPFHPFKGFNDIKYEGMGSLLSGMILLCIWFVSSTVRVALSGYIFNASYGEPLNLVLEASKVFIPFFIWGVSNWCITTLFSGEGSFKEILTAEGYAVVPLIAANFLITILSNIFSYQESMYINFIDVTAFLFTAFLLIIGMLQINQYSLFKTLLSSAFTIVGIAVILFIALLCFSLIQQIYVFFYSIVTELYYRSK